MKQKPNSTHKLFNLDSDAIEHIKEGSKLNKNWNLVYNGI